MVGILRIFFGSKSTNQWVVLVCLILAGLAEGIGLASLLPLLTTAGAESAEDPSPVSEAVTGALAFLGLPADLEILMAVVMVGLLLKSGLVILAMRYVGYAVAAVATGLRSELIDRLLRARWSYFTHQPVGRIANAISLDATRSGQAYLLAAQVVSTLIQCVVYGVVAFLVSWKLALLSIAIGGVIAYLLNALVRKAKRAGRRQTRRTEELVFQLNDALVGIKPLKAMARHAHFGHLFTSKIAALKRALERQVFAKELLRNLQEPLIAIVLCVGFYMAVRVWAIPMAELIVMGLLLHRMVATMGKVQQRLQQAVIVESAYWSVRKLIKEAADEEEPALGRIAPTLDKSCALDRVSFGFNGKAIMQDLSIEVPANKITVIMGPSGIGKTTVTDLLLGLYQPQQGNVLLDGVSLAEIDIEAWRAMVGYVPQELVLFHDSVFANVTLGDPMFGPEAAKAALQAADAWDFVAALPDGLDATVGERGMKLSGGQRQRIALARALVHRPRLLILDEVTSALDPKTEQEICRNIQSLSGQLTILVITHRPAWLSIADRVYEFGSEGLLAQPEKVL